LRFTSCVRWLVVYQAADDKANGSSFESGPGYLGLMSFCSAAVWSYSSVTDVGGTVPFLPLQVPFHVIEKCKG